MILKDFFNRFSRFTLPGAGQMALHRRWRQCVPLRWRRVLARRHRHWLLDVRSLTTAQQWRVSGEEQTLLGELDLSASADWSAQFKPEPRALPIQTVLRLPTAAVLTRHVSLPAQVRSNLAQVVLHELDRLSPFQAHEVFFTYRLLPTAPAALRLTLELALCRRDQVTGWLTPLATAGAPVACVTWAGAWADANLLPHAERPQRQPHVTLTHGLLALTAVLVLAGLFSPLWQLQHQVATVDAELRRVREQAVMVDTLRQELERARERSTVLVRQQQAQPSLLEVLRELTERLPDDTWIQTLEYSDGRVEVRGESGQATALIAILEQAPHFEEVTFKSPVTQIARTGKERFNLSLRVLTDN